MNHRLFIAFAFMGSTAIAQTNPLTPGELSATRLISVQRLTAGGTDGAPDGLKFCFLMSRTPAGQHRLALRETIDFTIQGRSYREATQATLGRAFEPATAVHDAEKYAREHPEHAAVISAAPPRSLVITIMIPGVPLEEGEDVAITLHVGFGRTPTATNDEDLTFRLTVPARQ